MNEIEEYQKNENYFIYSSSIRAYKKRFEKIGYLNRDSSPTKFEGFLMAIHI